MATRDYPRLNIEDFGQQLLDSGDLDPIYICLQRIGLPYERLGRWLVAYWTFYSAGVACYMSELEGRDYWEQMLVAARNETPSPAGGRWERGKERRHCRGAQGIACVEHLAGRYPTRPAGMLDYLAENESTEPLPFATVSERAQTHHLFGRWIAFKVGDMLERVVGIPVRFDEAEIFMFDDPRKAAVMLYDAHHVNQDTAGVSEDVKIRYSVDYLTSRFSQHMAPPDLLRPIGLQEIETILCKFKSHTNGHYPVGNDIHEITSGVKPWASVCPTAAKFLSLVPS